MEVTIGYILKGFVLPPGINFLAIVAALVLLRGRPAARRRIIGVSLVTLWMFCTPALAGLIARTLETYPALTPDDLGSAAAIVVLGGARYSEAPEYGRRDTLKSDTLERVRYAAFLARVSGLPVAVSGGAALDGSGEAVGQLMADVLVRELHVPVTWVESSSLNTAQNARHLARAPVPRAVVLVTHALHMPRAVREFDKAGFEVTAAPMGFAAGEDFSFGILAFLPSAGALLTSRDALHEWLGMAYYAMRYR